MYSTKTKLNFTIFNELRIESVCTCTVRIHYTVCEWVRVHYSTEYLSVDIQHIASFRVQIVDNNGYIPASQEFWFRVISSAFELIQFKSNCHQQNSFEFIKRVSFNESCTLFRLFTLRSKITYQINFYSCEGHSFETLFWNVMFDSVLLHLEFRLQCTLGETWRDFN